MATATADTEKAHSSDTGSELDKPKEVVTSSAVTDEQPVRQITGWKWFMLSISLYSSALMYGLDTTIAADVQGAVVETFGSVNQLAWLGTGFPLGSLASIIPIGLAYMKFDNKWVFIASLILFEVGSAVCGAAPSMAALIVGRVIAGVGGSGIYLGGLNFFTSLTTPKERPLYMSLIGVVWGLGTILGPVIGGAFTTSSATWRWAFYINLVVAAVSAPAILLYLPSLSHQPNVSAKEKLRSFDWLGITLIAGLYTSFTLAFTFIGTQWGWSEGRSIALLVVFGVICVATFISHFFTIGTTKENRAFPVQFLRSRTLVLCFISTAAGATALFIPVYYIPVYFQFVHGDSAIEAAVRLLPLIIITIFCVMANGALMPVLGYYSPWFLVAGMCSIIGGAVMYATVDPSTSPSHIYGFSVFMAFGAGLVLQCGTSIATVRVPPQLGPSVIIFVNTSQLLGIMVSLVISGEVFQIFAASHLGRLLEPQGFTQADVVSAIAGAQSAVFDRMSPELKAQAIDAIVSAISDVYILVIVAGAVNLLVGCGLKWERLFK